MHKVFVSYKYADNNVKSLYRGGTYFYQSTVRDYVTIFEEKAKNSNIAIYKGESDGEDLSHLSDETIWSKLKNRIYDSSVTIVFISPNMKIPYLADKEQWIPMEVAFSLREQSRAGRTSYSNSLLYVILPDLNGSYNYKLYMNQFEIIKKNECNGYAEIVNWDNFINNPSYYIEMANARKMKVASYLICKTV